MDNQQHSAIDWIANFVLMTIGLFTRLVFGDDHLSPKQILAFYVFCAGVVWIVDKLPINDLIKLTLILICGLIMPNIIKGIIKGAKSSETKVSDAVEKNIENISEKVGEISDVITKDKSKR